MVSDNLNVSSSTKIFASAKRKKSIAKLNLITNGSGQITVIKGTIKNNIKKTGIEYFQDQFLIINFLKPLLLVGKDKYDLEIMVSGGGLSGQASAVQLSIAKALLILKPALKPELKIYKFLTRDIRSKERKKIGKYGARRSPQFTKR